jgi:glycosyltransferase involved in cell wall biosynthesis
MTSAHVTVVTPGRCGLYETTRELVAGLRLRGVDARLVDPTRAENTLHPEGDEDRGAPFADLVWALAADVIVNHSGLGKELEASNQPVVHVAHGRPRSSFVTEVSGSTPIYSYHYAKNRDPKFKAVVTFWPEHVPYLRVMFPDKPVAYVPASVDLEAWTPDGPSGYQFHGHKGRVNVVCADAWREDVDPFTAVMATALWARETVGAKLHLYGAHQDRKGWAVLLRRLRDDGTLGEVQPWVTGLAHVYRAADCLVTPHVIATRTIREAMACGLPIVSVPGPSLDGFRVKFAAALETDRAAVRQDAIARFNPKATASAFEGVIRKAVAA